ncbi:hypothetical protein D3C78_1609810 [compost metagenome]
MLGLLGSLSAKIIFAPRNTNALAVDTKVKDGMMISSPGCVLIKMAAISSASVQDVVSSTFLKPNFDSKKV